MTAEQQIGLHPVCGGPKHGLPCDDHSKACGSQHVAGEPWPPLVASQREGSVLRGMVAGFRWTLVTSGEHGEQGESTFFAAVTLNLECRGKRRPCCHSDSRIQE